MGALVGAKSILEFMRDSQYHMAEGDAGVGQFQQPSCQYMIRVCEGDFEHTTVHVPAGAEQAWDTGQDEPDCGTRTGPKVLYKASRIHQAPEQDLP
jgi:hypothetical protein